jgi:hypothetical protein
VIGLGRTITFRFRDDPKIARFAWRAGGHSFGNTYLALDPAPEDNQVRPQRMTGWLSEAAA